MKITMTIVFNLISCVIMAQHGNSKLSGKVTDEKGLPVKNALVRIYSDGIAKAGTKTDKHGNYNILQIADGIYKIEVNAFSFFHFEKFVNIEYGPAQHDIQLIRNKAYDSEEIYIPCLPKAQQLTREELHRLPAKDVEEMIPLLDNNRFLHKW